MADAGEELGKVLMDLVLAAGNHFDTDSWSHVRAAQEDAVSRELWEDFVAITIESDPAVDATEKEQLIRARRGQGLFRERVQSIEPRCRVTGIDDPRFLIASHIKPWRVATNEERLDPNNGLMLSPNVDHLFDRGFISFSGDGSLAVASTLDASILNRLGVPADLGRIGSFNSVQREYLEFHRQLVFQTPRARDSNFTWELLPEIRPFG